MDDFLSKFDKDSYDKTKKEHVELPQADEKSSSEIKTEKNQEASKKVAQPVTEPVVEPKISQEPLADVPHQSGFDATGEVFEKDPDFKKKQQKKYALIGGLSTLACIIIGVSYYQLTHVKLPDFSNKPTAEVRTWATENSVKVAVEQKHDLKTPVNNVISQSPNKNKKIKKNTTLKLVVSTGADPEEILVLPDFNKMNKSAISKWQEEFKAENVTIIEEYDEKVKSGNFLKEEFKNKDLKREEYTRGDQLIIYLSKGKEVYKKDIAMPDFKGKNKAEVEKWATANKMLITYKEVSSDKVEDGAVVSQSISAAEKIAKETKLTIEISTGKGTKVPKFADLDMEAAGSVSGLSVQVKGIYTLDIAYGDLVSQSIPAGEMVSQKDAPIIKVVYSIGEPYLKSYFGVSEGELEKAFYEDYQSKGAQINYQKYYVDSSEERGTVVEMSTYNTYVGLNYTVKIGVSNGSSAPKPTAKMGGSGAEDNAKSSENGEDDNAEADIGA